jgi:hypothetical protein
MSLTVKQQISNQAIQLQQRLAEMKVIIDVLPPAEQIENSVGLLQNDSALLTQLQKKVEATYLKRADAIPEITDKELMKLSGTLSLSAEILESMDKNNETAVQYGEIASEIGTYDTLNESQVKSLQERIRGLMSSNPFLNQGIREAFESLELDALALPMHDSSPSPILQGRTNQLRQSRRADNLPLQTIEQDESRFVQQGQDEEYQASLFRDQYNDFQKTFFDDPIQDFEKALDYYMKVKQYSLTKTSFTSETAAFLIKNRLGDAEKLLNLIYELQAKNESQQVDQQVEVNQGEGVQREALKELHANIHKTLTASGDDLAPGFLQIDQTYRKIEHEEQMKIFDALSAILKEQKTLTRDLPVGLRRTSINQWPGSPQQKMEAVERVLSATGEPIAQVTVVKKADEMKRRLNEAINLQPAAPASPVKSNPPISTTFGMNRDLHTNLSGIRSLQSLLPLLRVDARDGELQEACALLQMLDSEGGYATFLMSEEKPRPIADRPRFHLYFIHKNETSQVNSDPYYGNKAFAGEFPATNEERLRSVQRTIAELALGALELPITLEDGPTVKNLLDLLEDERMKLNTKDRLNEQHSVAYNLFNAFYHLHLSGRDHNSSLTDPHDPQFGGDFGRVGFLRSMNGIDPAIKHLAINQVRNELKAAWKIE